METEFNLSGWTPEAPDIRDFILGDPDEQQIKDDRYTEMVKHYQDADVLDNDGFFSQLTLPSASHMKAFCSPVMNQGSLGSCTAQAAVSLYEFMENKKHGEFVDGSRLFVYKTTRNLMGLTGDTGATNRSTIGALAIFGMPPETYWPYRIGQFDVEPSAFCYSFGQSFQALRYARIDHSNRQGARLLSAVKTMVNFKIPMVFGFSVYRSISRSRTTGKVPFPHARDRRRGGHAVLAVGYDDNIEIDNGHGMISKGAILFQNSWGTGWGDDGFGWLPYDYVLKGLTRDWWTMYQMEYMDLRTIGARV
ncbi:C1 family peptidase [bacterium SCSIO 12741]|nr:C1 family peptidase [bacterium SCSIO 12741]